MPPTKGDHMNAVLRKSCWLMAASSLTLAMGTPAFAQDEAVSAAPQVEEAEQGGLQDIVVMARKRSETSQDVPVAVTAISALQIQRYDLTSMEKVAASIPQLTVGRNTTGSGAQITLRGIGTSPSSIGIEQSVATVVDGAYYGQGRIINEGFFDASGVEVLKGPQALFFGKNATAGVVSITSADPGDRFEALGRVGYEFRSQNLVGEGVVSSPLTETLGIRLAVRASNMFGGYFKNRGGDQIYTTNDRVTGIDTVHIAPAGSFDTPGEEEFLGRVTVKWQATDRLTATLKASASLTETNNPGWNRVAFHCASGNSSINASAPCGRSFTVRENAMPAAIAATIAGAGDGSLFNKYNSWGVTANLNYELDDVTLTSVTNYQKNRNRYLADGDFQASSATNTFALENAKWHAFSTELRALTTLDGPVNLMIGGLYQSTRRGFHQTVVNAGREDTSVDPANRYVNFEKRSFTDGETAALFGQVIWKVLPQVEMTGGVRYTHETKKSEFVQPYTWSPAFAPGAVVAADQTFNNWSPEATISWKPQRDVNLFVSYKTAYKSGGFSNSGINSILASVDDFTFEPEKARGFEGGIKSTLFDRQLRANLIAYSYTYSNLQIDFFNAPTFAFITTNAGSAKTRGVELELQYAPRAVPDLLVRGSLNYNRARYGSFLAPCYAGQTPAEGCTMTGPAPANTQLQDLTGVATAMAPRWTGSLGVGYDVPVGGAKLGLSVDAKYSDDYLTSGFGQPDSRQRAYVSLDASARLATDDDKWELALIGKNLTNRFIATGSIDGPSTGSGTGTAAGIHADQLGLISLPRTVQLQFTWKY